MRGLELAQKLKGNLPWKEVIEPSVTLAKEGFVVSKEFASEVAKNADFEIVFGHLNAGDIMQLHDIAETLSAVAMYGSDVLYNGTLSHKLLRGTITSDEQLRQLASYKPVVYTAERISFYGQILYYLPQESSLRSMTEALEKLQIPKENASTIEAQVHVARALIDSVSSSLHFMQNAEEERYTGVMAMDWEDTYVSSLTGLSAPLGLGYLTPAGFLFDKTDSFNNLSALMPIIFHSENALCGLRGVFGTDDVFLTGQLLYNMIARKLNVSAAIEYPRYYFLSDGLSVESNEKHTLDAVLHNQLNLMLTASHTDASFIPKSVNAIIKKRDSMASHSDSRGGGLASRF